MLRGFRSLRLGSWNYKGQDPSKYRHYGPMAQEWHAAFGRDGIGAIGNDTTLSSADMDGIAYIAIQALEKRSAELQVKTEEIARLRDRIVVLENTQPPPSRNAAASPSQ